MNLKLVIRKFTLSPFADASIWGKFNLLTGLPLTDDQFLKLINYYSAADSYRSYVSNIMTFSDGHGYKFASTPESLDVYSYFGVVETHSITDVLRVGDEYTEFLNCRQLLFAALGWVEHGERIVEVNSTFNNETLEFVGGPTTYQEIHDLYESAQSLESFLGK